MREDEREQTLCRDDALRLHGLGDRFDTLEWSKCKPSLWGLESSTWAGRTSTRPWRGLSSSIYPMKTRKKEMKAWLVSYRSAFMARGTLRRIGRPHTPSSWSRSGSRGRERPTATSYTRRGTSRWQCTEMTFLRLLTWTRSGGLREYAIKAEVLGPEPELSKEIKILNRSIRWCGDKLEYEVDSRHAKVIIEECEVQSWRAAKTPGVQEAAVDGGEKPWIAATFSLRQRNFVVRWPDPNPRTGTRPEESRGTWNFDRVESWSSHSSSATKSWTALPTATGQARGPPWNQRQVVHWSGAGVLWSRGPARRLQ